MHIKRTSGIIVPLILLVLLLLAAFLLLRALNPSLFWTSDDPRRTVKRFIEAQQQGDCEQIWNMFSTTTKQYITEYTTWLRKERADRPAEFQRFITPKRFYCRRMSQSARVTFIELARHDQNRALVRWQVKKPLPAFIMPFSIGHSYHDGEFLLVREEGEWRILIMSISERFDNPGAMLDS